MKKFTVLCSICLLVGVNVIQAITVPSHPKYITPIDGGKKFVDYFRDWQPGVPISADENFYISRVRMQERFTNSATQVKTTVPIERKFCWWSPTGTSDKYWGALPRNEFESDNFSMWQYLESHGGWENSWARVPGAETDIAHKNGVATGCLLFFDSGAGEANEIFALLTQKEGDHFKYSAKMIQFLKYYGIDGLGINPESSINSTYAPLMQDFFAECHKIAADYGWRFNIYWYGTMTNTGGANLGSTLDANKIDWFWGKGTYADYPIANMYMLNYNWDGSIDQSINTANNKKANSSWNVYAGFDTQGRWLSSLGSGGWTLLPNRKASIVVWGSHATNMVYENSADYGVAAIQDTYQKKLEQFFSGGNFNPANTPAVTNSVRGSSFDAMSKFHGISSLIVERSTMQNLPFVTRFNLGNGRFFNKNGVTTFPQMWYNIGVQDYLPTWRWWVVNNNGSVPNDPIQCTFTFDDAWFGGNCLKLHGATQVSNIRMFKTNFNVAKGDKVSLRYKVKNGTDPHLKLIFTVDGTTYQSYAIPAASKEGEWAFFEATANSVGMGGKTITAIGFAVENTTSNYEVLLGEFAITPNNKTYVPVTPQVVKAETLAGTYNTVDFKLIFKSKDQDPANPAEPIYNEDVDTWYFEIYTQPENKEPILCGTTTSWAAYVCGAPVAPSTETLRQRYGVRAIAPNGTTQSEIAWSEYQTRNYVQSHEVLLNKPIIKKNENFTLSFKDLGHDPVYWEIRNAQTGTLVTYNDAPQQSFTTSLDEEGYYDLKILDEGDTEISTIRGFIQISPMETGALPMVGTISSDKSTASTNEAITISYTADRLGEGKVSRALKLVEPYVFRLPNSVASNNNYSIGFWIKPSKFLYGQHGTNIINKRRLSDGWPHGTWGDFWMQYWPAWKNSSLGKDYPANFISFTMRAQMYNGLNEHENPNIRCNSGEMKYTLSVNTWTHVMISINNGKQKLFFNGKEVATVDYYQKNNNGPVYFGGSDARHAGFNGVIDDIQYWDKGLMTAAEVQDAMKGYDNRAIPENLAGYWNFETVNEDKTTIPNNGKVAGLNGNLITLPGTGSEATTSEEVIQQPDIEQLGNPAISGSLDVKTTAKWMLPSATITENNNTAVATYSQEGTFDASVILMNMWGEDKKTLKEYVVVTIPSSVDLPNVNISSVYPNPFVDFVNLQFATEGTYTIQVIAQNGICIDAQVVKANGSDIIKVSVNGAPGVYLLNILQNGKTIKTLKVNKQ